MDFGALLISILSRRIDRLIGWLGTLCGDRLIRHNSPVVDELFGYAFEFVSVAIRQELGKLVSRLTTQSASHSGRLYWNQVARWLAGVTTFGLD